MTQQSSTEQAENLNRAGRFGWRAAVGCVLLAVGVLAVTVLLPVFVRGQMLVLPLDDVYIHFQYARGIASGEPYAYNPGLPPSSGATSLLYPYLLAVGYAAGVNRAIAGLVGAGAGDGGAGGVCAWVLLHLARAAELWPGGAWLLAVTFALTGGISWHYMSGMETGLLVLFMLATLYAVITRRFWPGVAAAALMAVTRPEGAIMAVVFSGVMLLRWWVTWRGDGLAAYRCGVAGGGAGCAAAGELDVHGEHASGRQQRQITAEHGPGGRGRDCRAGDDELWAHVVGVADRVQRA